MTIPRLVLATAAALLAAGAVLAQDALPTVPAAPGPVPAAPVAPAPADASFPIVPPPEALGDPFSAGGGDATNIRLSAGLAKATQSIKVVGVGKSASGVAEAVLRLPDKSVVHVRPGESFTFVFGTGLVLPCEVVAITEQEIGLLVNGQTELRLR